MADFKRAFSWPGPLHRGINQSLTSAEMLLAPGFRCGSSFNAQFQLSGAKAKNKDLETNSFEIFSLFNFAVLSHYATFNFWLCPVRKLSASDISSSRHQVSMQDILIFCSGIYQPGCLGYSILYKWMAPIPQNFNNFGWILSVRNSKGRRLQTVQILDISYKRSI